MSEFNVNVSGSQVTGGFETTEAQETIPGQIGHSQKDTITEEETFPEIVVPSNSNRPQLNSPNYTLINQPRHQGFVVADPVEIEQQVKELLETNPELTEYVALILNRRGTNTPEGRKELIENIRRYISSRGGNNIERSAKEALASQLQGLLNTASPEEAKEIQRTLNQLRIGLLTEDAPETEVLVWILNEKYIKEGHSPKEARMLAEAEALASIDTYLSDKGVTTPVFTPHPLNAAALESALIASLPDTLDALEKEALIKGIIYFLGIERGITRFFTEVQKVEGNEGVANANYNRYVNNGENVVITLDELVTQLKNDLDSLPLTDNQKNSLREYLQYLAAMVMQLKEMLNQVAVLDARKSQELSVQQQMQSNNLFDATILMLKEMMKDFMRMEKLGGVLKPLGYVVAIILTIIGAVLAPFTGGASLALAIAITVLIFVAITILSETGVMEKIFELVGELIESAVKSMCELLGFDAPKWLIQAIKIAIYIAIIVAIIVASRGTAVSSLSPLLQTMVVQVTTTIVTQIIANSRMIQDFVEITVGQIPGIDDEVLMWINAILTIIVMIIVCYAAASAMKNISMKTDPKELAKSFGKDIYNKLVKMGIDPRKLDLQQLTNAAYKIRQSASYMSAGAQGVQAGAALYEGIASIKLAEIKEQEAEYEALIITIKEIIKLLRQMIDMLQGDIENTLELAGKYTELFERTVSGLQDTMASLSSAQAA